MFWTITVRDEAAASLTKTWATNPFDWEVTDVDGTRYSPEFTGEKTLSSVELKAGQKNSGTVTFDAPATPRVGADLQQRAGQPEHRQPAAGRVLMAQSLWRAFARGGLIGVAVARHLNEDERQRSITEACDLRYEPPAEYGYCVSHGTSFWLSESCPVGKWQKEHVDGSGK